MCVRAVQVLDYLRHVPSFGKLSKEKLEKLFEVLDLQDYAAGETVFKKGEVSVPVRSPDRRRARSHPDLHLKENRVAAWQGVLHDQARPGRLL